MPEPTGQRERTIGGFDMHSFCDGCGAHRRRMPFGTSEDFFDRGPCASCGWRGPGHHEVARRVRLGVWPWPTEWRDRDGVRVDVPEVVPDGR